MRKVLEACDRCGTIREIPLKVYHPNLFPYPDKLTHDFCPDCKKSHEAWEEHQEQERVLSFQEWFNSSD